MSGFAHTLAAARAQTSIARHNRTFLLGYARLLALVALATVVAGSALYAHPAYVWVAAGAGLVVLGLVSASLLAFFGQLGRALPPLAGAIVVCAADAFVSVRLGLVLGAFVFAALTTVHAVRLAAAADVHAFTAER